MRYSSKRSYEWSAAIAYTVGLMASDVCLQRNGRHLDITSKDRDQLIHFSRAMGRDFYIGSKNNGTLQQAYRIQFSDVAYYDFLLSAGLTPAKSKTLGDLNIPYVFYADFLRGLFDGDGTSYAYMDARWKSSFMFYIGFTSASPAFITYLRRLNAQLIDVSQGSMRKGARALTLYYAKSDSHKIFQYMYYEGHPYYLARKKTKLAAFIQKDRPDIIVPLY